MCCYDHHSYILGTWIGEYNRKEHFFLLILILIHSIISLPKISLELQTEKIIPYPIVLCIIFCFLLLIIAITWAAIMLLLQLYLLIFNWTTHEKFYSKNNYLAKTKYATSNHWKSFFCHVRSPFSKGIIGNFSDYFWKWKYRVTNWKFQKTGVIL